MTLAGRNPTSIIPTVLQAFADEHPGQRISMIGESTWPTRSSAGYLGAVQHEALINLAFADQDAAILCAYGTSGLQATIREDVGRTHPYVFDNGHGPLAFNMPTRRRSPHRACFRFPTRQPPLSR